MSVDTLLRTGIASHASGRLKEAEQFYRQVLAQVPDHPDANNFMGVLAYNVGKNDLAIAYIRKAIERMPLNSGCFNNMGNVFQQQEKYRESVKWYEMSVRIKPANKMAHNNIAVAYLNLGILDKALASVKAAIDIDPEYAEAHSNHGEILRAMGDNDGALVAINKAISLSADMVSANWNRALIWLSQGNFQDGWPAYEWRWRRPTTRSRVFAHGTAWQGQDVKGKVLFVYEEQGLGDTLQFIRYLPKLQALGARVVFETGTSLIRLVADNRLYDRLLVALKSVDTRPVDRFDFHVPLLSLPHLLKTKIDTIPDTIPYLKADPALCRVWKNRISGDNSFKIGLVWAGRPDHKNDVNRSIHLSLFETLGKIEGASFYSLQKEKHEKWTNMEGLTLFEKDLGPEISDFADTAAIIENMDLVISVDTSVVHLAGALGKPVWTLLPFSADFRWLLEREDSPWYPTMRLFRQTCAGEWMPVMQRVQQALAEKMIKLKKNG
ncbi:tetratricopeptide repeat-containing glycosyltransferase family protein [uncultured Desulfobacter sp.]|uniref:tetratricopeptide repeat-containing glycosyltransferase family protein n=1 Tax=uncultured Desulfobacter sp. TaxID=240139 RepID=UPI002AAA7100|nr:tetratricopeptide repeat-containing glycosyltransferase family protein [uncultured Desulfobacter sp.]